MLTNPKGAVFARIPVERGTPFRFAAAGASARQDLPVWASPQHPLCWVPIFTGELAVDVSPRRVLGLGPRSRRWGGLDDLGWP